MPSGKVYIFNRNSKKRYSFKNREVIFLDKNFIDPELVLSEDDIFITSFHQTPLECRLEHYNIPSDSLVISSTRLDIDKILENEDENFRDDYAIFSGQKINSDKKEIKIIVLQNCVLLSNIIYQMLEAGYLEEEDLKKIDDWILSFEHPLLKIFNLYHKIETSNTYVEIEEEFLINPAFRKTILIAMMKIMANFIINNGMITVEKVSKMGEWNNKETWKLLKEQVKMFKI